MSIRTINCWQNTDINETICCVVFICSHLHADTTNKHVGRYIYLANDPGMILLQLVFLKLIISWSSLLVLSIELPECQILHFP